MGRLTDATYQVPVQNGQGSLAVPLVSGTVSGMCTDPECGVALVVGDGSMRIQVTGAPLEATSVIVKYTITGG